MLQKKKISNGVREEIAGQVEISKEKFKQTQGAVKNVAQLKKEIEKNLSGDVSRTVEVMLSGPIVLNASDIHIEPEEEKVKLRVRIDGMLHDVLLLAPNIYKGVLSRIKLLSGIKLNVTDRPQDGHFSVLLEESQIEIRVSTLPSEYGESTVMRVLNPKALIEIEDLGVREDMKKVFEEQVAQPDGMIIVTGPTGSGKTTTLYAVLKKIQKPELKIITIEDPIEYHLRGISQSQVNPKKGYGFANGLQAIVRQDPDVILVGEIRDFETAKIALQAALTGHLVLTTLHTNDAAGTIVRLQALGEKPINIAPAINLAIAQRLVRKVCPKCVKLETPSVKEMSTLKNGLKTLSKKARRSIKIPPLDKNLKIPKIKGCPVCNSTGYKGRLGLFEFFLNDDEMQVALLKSPSIAELRKKAKEKGMVTMKEDGFVKVLLGQTTIKEIERIMGV